MELHKPTYRVVKILELLEAAKKTGKSLSDISKILEIPKGTVSPVLKTLENLNYITFNPQTHRYTLGFRAFELGLDYGSDTDVIAMLQKNMQAIVRDINEICQLGVLSGPDVLYILKESPNNAVAIRSSIGAKLPAYATGLGKALLSGKTDNEIKALYHGTDFVKYTPNTIDNLSDLLTVVQQVRKTQFAYEMEESNTEICCIAVPLLINKTVEAAISVTIPVFRYNDQKKQAIEQELQTRKQLIEKICKIQNYHLPLTTT